MANLATSERLLGHYSEAEKLYREVFETRRRILGADHPDTLNPMLGLAAIYFARKQFAEAESMWQQLVDSRRRSLGAEHVMTITAVTGLAETKSARGRHAEAEKLLLESLPIATRVLGAGHYDTLLTAEILAHVQARQGRYGESEKLQLDTLATARRALGQSHPIVGRCLYDLGILALQQGDRKRALDFLRQALDSGLSPDQAMRIDEDDELKELRSQPEFQALVNRTKKI